jgi:hypothetical protein
MMTCNVQWRGSKCVATAILGATVAGGLITAAIAQTPPSSMPEKPPAQIPEKVAPPLDSPGPQGGVNHEKFERDDGVIRPRDDVDPDMTATPPDTGARMPVIPPPGGPGGDPSIKPK